MRPLRALLVVAVVAAAAVGDPARAEGYLSSRHDLSTLLSVTWEAALPAPQLRGFVDRFTPRAGQLEIRFGVARHLSLGMSGTVDWFSQSFGQGSVQFPDATLSGAAYRRVLFATGLATAHWYVTSGALQPYLGVGAGGGWHGSHAAVGDAIREESGYHWAVDPRAGFLVTIRPGLALHLQGRYQLTTASFAGVKNARWYAADVGVAVY